MYILYFIFRPFYDILVPFIRLFFLPFILTSASATTGVQTPLAVAMLVAGILPLTVALGTMLSRRSREVATNVVVTALFAVAIMVVVLIAGMDRNGMGHQVLTSAGVLSYIALCGAPIIAYTLMPVRLLKMSTDWLWIYASISLLAAWFWTGYAANLVGGALW